MEIFYFFIFFDLLSGDIDNVIREIFYFENNTNNLISTAYFTSHVVIGSLVLKLLEFVTSALEEYLTLLKKQLPIWNFFHFSSFLIHFNKTISI